jgi:preprotein translocase subunit SecG
MCSCPTGFSYNETTEACTNIDACHLTPCHRNAVCADRPPPFDGSFAGRSCVCNTGYKGDGENCVPESGSSGSSGGSGGDVAGSSGSSSDNDMIATAIIIVGCIFAVVIIVMVVLLRNKKSVVITEAKESVSFEKAGGLYAAQRGLRLGTTVVNARPAGGTEVAWHQALTPPF